MHSPWNPRYELPPLATYFQLLERHQYATKLTMNLFHIIKFRRLYSLPKRKLSMVCTFLLISGRYQVTYDFDNYIIKMLLRLPFWFTMSLTKGALIALNLRSNTSGRFDIMTPKFLYFLLPIKLILLRSLLILKEREKAGSKKKVVIVMVMVIVLVARFRRRASRSSSGFTTSTIFMKFPL